MNVMSPFTLGTVLIASMMCVTPARAQEQAQEAQQEAEESLQESARAVQKSTAAAQEPVGVIQKAKGSAFMTDINTNTYMPASKHVQLYPKQEIKVFAESNLLINIGPSALELGPMTEIIMGKPSEDAEGTVGHAIRASRGIVRVSPQEGEPATTFAIQTPVADVLIKGDGALLEIRDNGTTAVMSEGCCVTVRNVNHELKLEKDKFLTIVTSSINEPLTPQEPPVAWIYESRELLPSGADSELKKAMQKQSNATQ